MSQHTVPAVWTPPFIPSLLKAYAVIDGGARLALRQETALREAGPACRKGCSQCCSRGDAPVSAVEMAGALWHTARRVDPEVGRLVRTRLSGDTAPAGCPFLVEGACAVYSMRFASCRQQFVFGRPCLPGEDPAMTRSADMFTPMRQFALRGFSLIAPYLGQDVAGRAQPFRDEALRELSAPVKTWSIPDTEQFVKNVALRRPAAAELAA